MKTNTKTQNQKSGLLNRPEQLSTSKTRLPRIDLKRRFHNRGLPTDKVLVLLYHETPRFWELVEVVGKWVWIQFDGKQPSTVTSVLAELGFHWNNTRQTWQHPCGLRRDQKAPYDPRRKYGSYFPADNQRA